MIQHLGRRKAMIIQGHVTDIATEISAGANIATTSSNSPWVNKIERPGCVRITLEQRCIHIHGPVGAIVRANDISPIGGLLAPARSMASTVVRASKIIAGVGPQRDFTVKR